ncbi:MAG: sigma-70 family RNA polymerase sigma factor [Ignavibacteriales bacterium]|nr:sigma-70 family RNA polymerase sigma factor [Ignavibacteriales bacterium]
MADEKEFELVKNFINGDEKSFNKIVNEYQKLIYWNARRMLGNHYDADEITQQVIIVLYNKLKTFKFNSSLKTWIYKITFTRSLNLIKKNKIKNLFSIDEPTADFKNENDIVKNLENREKLERLNNVLDELPIKQKEVFILRKFDELSYEEISEITGKSIGGLKANYFHALNKILTKLDDYE